MSNFTIETLGQPEGWCGGPDGSTRWEDYLIDAIEERLNAIVGLPRFKVYEDNGEHDTKWCESCSINWRYVEGRLEEEGLAPGKLAEILNEPGNEHPIADIDL